MVPSKWRRCTKGTNTRLDSGGTNFFSGTFGTDSVSCP